MIKSKYKNHTIAIFILVTISILVSVAYFYTVEKRKTYLSNMVKYHTKMIKSGSISSLVKLGEMYEKGEGVKKDLVKAKELFKKAINYNQYLDEINPSYSNNAKTDEDFTDSDISIDIDINNIGYIETSESIDSETNLENEATIPVESEIITAPSQNNSTVKNNNIKYVPYKKSTFSNILVSEDTTLNKKLIKSGESTTTRQFKLRDNLTSKTKPQQKKQNVQKITKAIAEIKKSEKEILKKSKEIAEAKEKALKKSKAIAAKKKKAKRLARKKARKKAKAIAKKKEKLKARKIAKAKALAKAKKLALALKKKTLKTKYKKTKRLSKRKKKTKKTRLEARRAPNLNEQRPDTNFDLGLDNDENQTNSTTDTSAQQEVIEQQTVDNNFTSNPCDTESARYIAKCRRANRNK